MTRFWFLAYGATAYLLFLGTFVWAIGFVANLPLSPSILDGEASLPIGQALFVNAVLLGVFAVQHSVMARPGFKQCWTRVVPKPIERATYVLFSSAAMWLLFIGWQPLPQTVYAFTDPVLRFVMWSLFGLGIGTILLSTFLIDHFDLFGLRQVWLHFRGRVDEPKRFVTPFLYQYIRHPLYVGWFLFFWATPDMTLGHLLLAVGTTAYILVAVIFEERDLAWELGDEYRRWREETPAFLPRPRRAHRRAVERRRDTVRA